jgi:hypothetical protein
MRVIIVPKDGFVSVNGEGYSDLDLRFMDASIHAIQWYGSEGELEREDTQGRVVGNEKITNTAILQPALDVWRAKKNTVAQHLSSIPPRSST